MRAPSGLPATKKPVDAADPMKNAVQLAEGSRAAAEEASNSTQRTWRVQELQKQMADLEADTGEILKAVAASRDR